MLLLLLVQLGYLGQPSTLSSFVVLSFSLFGVLRVTAAAGGGIRFWIIKHEIETKLMVVVVIDDCGRHLALAALGRCTGDIISF